jgi:asparagine N-glycosylation enzyme membrane subunit Stt3
VAPLTIAVLSQTAAGAEPRSWADVFRHDVAPVASAYVVFVIMLIAYARNHRRSQGPGRRPVVRIRARTRPRPVAWADLTGYVVGTAFGGYAVFLAIVLIYYLALGGEDRRFVVQAFREGSVLTFAIVVPGLLLISWLHDCRHRRGGILRDGPSGTQAHPSGGRRWPGSRDTGSAT